MTKTKKTQQKRKSRILTFVLALIFVIAGFCGGFVGYIFISKPDSDIFVDGSLNIHFLQLGNHYAGDSIFIQCGETTVLIDAGSRTDSATTLISYIDEYVTDQKIDYVIATHSDQDHISAFYSTSKIEGIFDHYEVKTIIDFPLTNKTNPTATSVLGKYYAARDKEVEEGANHYSALECYNNENGGQRTYQLSPSVELEILYNYYYENTSGDENNYSVCVMLNQGDNHYLLTGDLEKDGEKHLVDYYKSINNPLPHCVLFKAGHHGSYTSSTTYLLQEITPEYVVVSCCAGTSEYSSNPANQFPSQNFVNNVAPFTKKVYVTSVVDYYTDDNGEQKEKQSLMNGNIVMHVKGTMVTIECSNSDTLLKDSTWFKANRTCPSAWA